MDVDKEKIIDLVVEKLANEIKETINLPTLRILVLDSLKNILAKRIAEKLVDKIFSNIKLEITDTIVVKVKGVSIEVDLESLQKEINNVIKDRIIEKIMEGVKISLEE